MQLWVLTKSSNLKFAHKYESKYFDTKTSRYHAVYNIIQSCQNKGPITKPTINCILWKRKIILKVNEF